MASGIASQAGRSSSSTTAKGRKWTSEIAALHVDK